MWWPILFGKMGIGYGDGIEALAFLNGLSIKQSNENALGKTNFFTYLLWVMHNVEAYFSSVCLDLTPFSLLWSNLD